MAAYPSFGQVIGASGEEWVDDITIDRAVNGTVKARAFYSSKKRLFRVRHFLNSTDRATFETFYNANRLLSFTFTWNGNGQVYTCLFAGPPRFEYPSYNQAYVDVVLVEQ